MSQGTRHLTGLIAILAAYLVITVSYGIVNPLFEAPDEHSHYFTAHFIADHGELPIVSDDPIYLHIGQEAAQPPLYYWLGAQLIRPIDRSNAYDAFWPNPRVQLGDASSPTNLNFAVHDVSAESFPWDNYIAAAHLLRTLSTLFGLGTLLLFYAAARTLWPQAPSRALLAVAIPACLPQFNFLHSYINNDVAIIFFASLTLLLLIRLYMGLATHRASYVAMGVVVGLAILSKTSGLALLAYAVGFILVVGWHKRIAIAQQVLNVGLLCVSALLVSGWWLWRNWQLYQDITATRQFVQFAGEDAGISLFDIPGQSSGIARSLVAVFGWFNVLPPDAVYWLWLALTLIAMGGVIARWRGIKSLLLPLLLAGWLLVIYAALVSFMLRTSAAQGRLIMPALLPITLLIGYGLDYWRQRFGNGSVAALLALPIVSLLCLFFVIRPTYAYSPVVSATDEAATAIMRELAPGITLEAALLGETMFHPGDTVGLTLFWRGDRTFDVADEIVVELFGRNNTPIAKLQSYHGGGLYPTTLWTPGELIRSEIGLRLDQALEVPTQARVNVRVVNAGDGVDVGYVQVVPDVWPEAGDALAVIGDGIEIISAEFTPQTAKAGDTLILTLTWHITRVPGQALTTLVHLGPADQQPLAQGDSSPLNGDYPTSWWPQGATITDSYIITLPTDTPPGQYPLRIGMYTEQIVRLPMIVADQASPDGSFTVGHVVVEK